MGTRFTLNLQGIAELTDTVTMTVLGLEPQESFPQRIAEVHTPLDAKGRSALIAEIDKKIFIEIKNRLHGPNEKSESL